MTARKAGALIDDAKRWHSIDWKAAQRNVRRLQMRIAKAVTLPRHGVMLTTGILNKGNLLKCLSRYDGKLSCAVLRGLGTGNSPLLPDPGEHQKRHATMITVKEEHSF